MSKINRAPLGFQGLLGSSNQGKNPDQLSETVRAVVDLTPFLGVQSLRARNTTGSRTAPGLIASLDVGGLFAANQVGQVYWALQGLSINLDGVVNATPPAEIRYSVHLDDLNNNVNRSHCIASSEDLACENNDNVVWGWTSPRIIVLDLNTRIEFYLDRYDGFAGSNSFQISALYNELPG